MDIGTWNVTSLYGKEQELVQEIEKYRLDIVGLSSTHSKGSGTVNLEKGWTLYYSGVNVQERGKAGVGILTSPRLTSCVLEWIPEDERVCAIRVQIPRGQVITFVSVYAPNTEADYPGFLDKIAQLIDKVPVNDSIVVLGDFNAHVGVDDQTWKGVIGRNGDAHINKNGEMVLDFCANNALSITNTFFQHKASHKYTWKQDTRGYRSIIDFIVVSNDLRRLVLDTRVKRGAELSTDHHLVVSRIRFEGKKPDRPRTPKRTTRIRWEELANENIRTAFEKHIRNRYPMIPNATESVEKEWGLFKNAVIEAATESCGLKRVGAAFGGCQRTPWWNEEVKSAVQRKKTAFKGMLCKKTVEAIDKYRAARKEAAQTVREAKARAWEEFGKVLEDNHKTAVKVFWQKIRRIRRGKQDALRTVKSKSGEVITDSNKVLARWREHFKELLNPVEATPDNHISRDNEPVEPILLSEVIAAVHNLKNGKAAGIDEIRSEMLKAMDRNGCEWLTRVINVAWLTGKAPKDWQQGIVIPLFKKGDHRECSNYRGITLLSQAGKVYAKVLEMRCRRIVEPLIQEEQCGFRPGRGTTDQIFTLAQIYEKSWEYGKPVHTCFIDLEKAYDRVPRSTLWEVLEEYNISGALLRAIKSLYNQCGSCVRVNGLKSKTFTVKAGLRQGCVLSPLLFTVFMDRISRRSQGSEGISIGDARASNLLFADDVAKLATTRTDLQKAIDRFNDECNASGMKISVSKTQAMTISRIPHESGNLSVSGAPLTEVEKFKYLGVTFTCDGKWDTELTTRIGAAAGVLRQLYRTVVTKRELSTKTKLSIYKSVYRPILTYGHEHWVMTERMKSRIQAAEMRFLRRISGLTLLDRVRSSDIRENLQVSPLLLWIERSQLKWLGHLIRMPPERLVKQVYEAIPTGKRPRGRPRRRWKNYIYNVAEERLGLEKKEIENIARDREAWFQQLGKLQTPRP
jgi:exonuclease III